MKRLLLILALLLAPIRALPANGDVVGAAVEDNGWVMSVWLSGNQTNGTFAFGLGPRNALVGTEKAVLTITSPGYNDDGSTNQTVRRIVGTKQLRFPYPDENFVSATNDGSNTRIRFALSEFVHAGDVSGTLTMASGVYSTNAFTSASCTSQPVTNNSTQPYPQAIANWTWPDHYLVTNNTMTLRAVGFHSSAQDGRPLRAMRFTVTDGSITSTQTVTSMVIDRSMPDQIPFGEYVSTFDVSGMANGARLKCNFVAFPWVGDSTATIDTAASVSTNAWPTGWPTQQTNILDRLQTFGRTRAIVDPVSGVNATGVAANEVYWATNQSPAPFLNVGAALVAIAGTNNASYGRNNVGGGIVLMTAGDHNWLGSSVTLAGTDQEVWCDFMNLTNGANVINYATDGRAKDDKDMWHVYGLSISNANSITTAFSRTHLWFDRMYFNHTGAGLFAGATAPMMTFFTHCQVTNLTQGIKTASGNSNIVALVRGNDLTGFSKIVQGQTVVGNEHRAVWNGSTKAQVISDSGGQQWQSMYGGIVYNNAFYGLDTGGNLIQTFSLTNLDTRGYAAVQNVFEGITNVTTTIVSQLSAGTGYHYTNQIFWNNTFVGHRTLLGYNDVGSTPYYRHLWSVKNMLVDDWNIKTDTHTTKDGNRVGNWPLVWGVGCAGNFDIAGTGMGASDSFINDDPELNGFGGIGWYCYFLANSGSTSPSNWPAFTSDLASDAVNYMPGNGVYSLKSESPIIGHPTDWVLPFDISGNDRSRLDPPGAFNYATPLRAGTMFSY
jgi:hypothetical protein